jgi:hypothetical protein
MKKSEATLTGNASSIFKGGTAEISNDDDDGIYDPYTGESIFIDDESVYA